MKQSHCCTKLIQTVWISPPPFLKLTCPISLQWPHNDEWHSADLKQIAFVFLQSLWEICYRLPTDHKDLSQTGLLVTTTCWRLIQTVPWPIGDLSKKFHAWKSGHSLCKVCHWSGCEHGEFTKRRSDEKKSLQRQEFIQVRMKRDLNKIEDDFWKSMWTSKEEHTRS